MGSIPTRSRHPGGRTPARRGATGPDGRRIRTTRRGRASPPAERILPAAPALTALALTALAFAALALGAAPAAGQEPDTTAAPPDTTAAAGVPAEPDTAAGPPVSPLGAFARSMVLPGWGQAEVDKPVRGAFYFAAEAASLWMVVKSQAKLSSARRGAAPGTGDTQDGDTPLEESRTSQRENWIVLSVFVALMSGVDAWVSAHLYDFEGELEPPEDGTAGVQLRYSVPVEVP